MSGKGLAVRVTAVAVPGNGGGGGSAAGGTSGGGEGALGWTAECGLVRGLLALPFAFVAVVHGLRRDPAWAKSHYVPDLDEHRRRDEWLAARRAGAPRRASLPIQSEPRPIKARRLTVTDVEVLSLPKELTADREVIDGAELLAPQRTEEAV